jgi:2-succinyl-5-enolpyruvyl-6-hydroxy-3-cyclohexene-1-carboxylate synthase
MKMELEKIFFCTGARNHDLLKSFHNQTIQFEYDERMASFMAMGLLVAGGCWRLLTGGDWR